MVSREIEPRGAFRFRRRVRRGAAPARSEPAFDAPVSAVVPVRAVESAFALAADRGRSRKVLPDRGTDSAA
ncbi:hypothetical protein GCM10010279_45720 [Streptomyces mutabilis]|nr:hypothetical protein GCM10010279_45720 [Streptomyces mutabilis]